MYCEQCGKKCLDTDAFCSECGNSLTNTQSSCYRYFYYAASEEEINEQYRKLLVKYDYRNIENRGIIDSISKEYERILGQVRYDNGYRTIGQKLKEMVIEEKESYIAYKNERNLELDRRNKLANRKWTNEELSLILEEMRECLKRVIPMQFNSGDKLIIDSIKMKVYSSKRKKELYDACTERVHFINQGEAQIITEIKEKLEYCVLSLLNGDDDMTEKQLRNIEDNFGEFAEGICREYIDENIDPIEEMRLMKLGDVLAGNKEKAEADWKLASLAVTVFASIPGVVILFICLLFVVEGGLFDSETFGLLIVGVIWLWVTTGIHKANKTRIERHNRIVGKQKNIQEKTNGSIVRIITRGLFRW